MAGEAAAPSRTMAYVGGAALMMGAGMVLATLIWGAARQQFNKLIFINNQPHHFSAKILTPGQANLLMATGGLAVAAGLVIGSLAARQVVKQRSGRETQLMVALAALLVAYGIAAIALRHTATDRTLSTIDRVHVRVTILK